MPKLTFSPGDDTQPFWVCPDGTAHEWLFRRSTTGEGFYRCKLCACLTEKRDLKRATDNPEA